MVEDDEFLRALASRKFTEEGFLVVLAVDGEQGVLLAEKEIPDLILMDVILPGIDGFEALRRIGKNPALKKTHIFMLSNFGQTEDIERARALGAEQFLVKAHHTLDEISGLMKESLAKSKK